ncbi:uncharacterized protein Ecym_3523 [Eremothecium cymbalariae DBVPG|uniref:polynucleotide adenylyltransferase n=1 Tax=Eremothecium cymbalariae (strain CBS 270.75 / DBVPG 7215 / KCTC 17166 / NRRL Y-17582) TaxID=931890 RepID=G8JQL7_ERECY|nr:Hypothetical protein Ecym_3523 [Eremothecium cymbalariae DBVPG\
MKQGASSNSKRFGSKANPSSKRGKVKKMRKSSLSRVQRNFSVFHNSSEHENKYANLSVVNSDGEEVILIEDDEVNDDESGVMQEIDLGEDEDSNEEYDEDGSSKSSYENAGKSSGNALDKNDDFIGFSSSDEEHGANGEHQSSDTSSSYEEETTEQEVSAPKVMQLNNDYPWILNHDHSKQKEIADWLTLEIKDFVSYISPNREEIRKRNDAITKIRKAVKSFWPDSDLHCFGSYATDLYLPGSDIDCVVNSKSGDKDNKNALYSFASYLRKNGLASQVSVIAKARVPIIKFVEPVSQIHIDVSFERTNGVDAAKIIRGWLGDTPGLRELVLTIKQFLYARRLNDVHIGGLGGFSIICLTYSFLKLHPRIICQDVDPLQNLGVLLIDFFELYGKNFGYDDVGIAVSADDAKYINKKDYPELTQNLRGSFNLVIQDPGDPCNNISRGTFNVRDIKKAFAGAFDLLANKCFELDAATFKVRLGKSILGNVIKYRGARRDFKDERGLVVNKAIQENEEFHQKRGRIVLSRDDDEFINISDEEDMYDIEEPPKKKSKKNTSNVAKSKDRKARQPPVLPPYTVHTGQNIKYESSDDYDPTGNDLVVIESRGADVNAHSSAKQNASSRSEGQIDKLMGLDDTEDKDDYQPVLANNHSDGAQEDDDQEDYVPKVDKETKRNYWLGKGQSM